MRPDVEFISSQLQLTSADCMDVVRQRIKLENLNRQAAFQQRFRHMHLLASFAAIKRQIKSIMPATK